MRNLFWRRLIPTQTKDACRGIEVEMVRQID